MSSKALVSTIIPVHNGERYLAEAIESVLAQTYRPVEVIVVDDGSTDGSAHVARSFGKRVRYCFQAQHGQGAARNLGVESARGSFIAFLDADDLWMKEKLTLQMAALADDPALDMVFGHVRQFQSPDSGAKGWEGTRQDGTVMPGYFAGTVLIRRDSFQSAGPFQTHWRVAEFIDWYSKAVEAGLRGVMLPDILLERRLHGGNLGIRERSSRADYVRVLKASLDRRRGIGHKERKRGQ